MKKLFSLMMVLAMAGICAYAQDAAKAESSVVPEEKEWSVSLSLTYANKYMTDGIVWTDGDMLFPDLTVSYKGFYAGIWGAMDLNSQNDQSLNPNHGNFGNVKKGNFEEIDFYFGYEKTIEDLDAINSLTVRAQWAYYKYPQRFGAWFGNTFYRQSDGTTQKVTIDLTTGLFLNPGVQLDWTYEEKGWLLTFHASHSMPLATITEKLTFDNSFKLLAGNRKALISGRKGISSFIWTPALNYQCCDNVSFGPFANLIWHLDNCVREAAADDYRNHKFETVLGFAVNANF